jgi:putative membrane protein
MKLKSTNLWRLTPGLIAAAALVASPVVWADEHDKDTKKDTSEIAEKASEKSAEKVIKHAAMANTLEIRLGNLAKERAISSEVKDFAEKLVSQHKEAQEKLKEVADKHKVALPVSLDDKYLETYQRMSALSGEQFDREFAKQMVRSHAMAIQISEEVAKEHKEEDVREYAKEQVPTLREHLQAARQMAQSVGVDQATLTQIEAEPLAVGAPGAGTERGVGTGQAQPGETPRLQDQQRD